ncbi:unnamed protein product [Effrenium voratum]|nr:unnamed protein product [Effrenium voratum]
MPVEPEYFYKSFDFLWAFASRDKPPDGTYLSRTGPPQVCIQEPLVYGSRPARKRCSFGASCKRANPQHFLDESHPGDPDFGEVAIVLPSVTPGPQLHLRDQSFDWIRFANDKQDRDLRAETAALTLKACLARGYQLNAVVPLQRVDALLEGTKLIKLDEVAASNSRARLSAESSTALGCALRRAQRGEKVAVLGAASAYHPCGGFRTGGRHALEESMCVQSSLCLSLQRAVWLSSHGGVQVPIPERLRQDGRRDWFCYIPEQGAVLSPFVEVFRKGSDEGYAFLSAPVELAAVVSVAMPNKNPSVKDSPLDAPQDAAAYKALLVSKFQVALGAASLAGASTCVVPGVGCGIFKNDPGDMGAALKEAMARGCGKLREVVLAGVPPEFAKAAQ